MTIEKAKEAALEMARGAALAASERGERNPLGRGYADPETGEAFSGPYCGGDRSTWFPAPGKQYVRAVWYAGARWEGEAWLERQHE